MYLCACVCVCVYLSVFKHILFTYMTKAGRLFWPAQTVGKVKHAHTHRSLRLSKFGCDSHKQRHNMQI